MMERITLINELEFLLQECFKTIDNFRGPKQIKENDARVAFDTIITKLENEGKLRIVPSKWYI
jgi:hypothetical protein